MAFDLIIRGGSIADGRGSPLFEADIAVSGGRIAEVGDVSGTAVEEIDANGLLVAPGFVDIHSHYDGQAMWDHHLTSSCWHGVTTTVMSNCGLGFAPVKAGDRDLLIEFMEGVEDIPAAVLRDGLSWDWSTFPEYLDVLAGREFDMDVCAQMPHSALRVYVMGERAVRREEATADDIAAMRALTTEAIEAGALGFSTSRTLNHRTMKGEPIPSLGATGDELAGIAMGLRDAGQGVLQIIADLPADTRRDEFALMRRMMEESGRPLSVTVLQRNNDPDGWREFMALLDGAVGDGLSMYAQVTPRPLGTLFGLDMGRHPFSYHPSYKAIAGESLARRVEIMQDPSFREKLLSEEARHHVPQQVERVQFFDYMFPLGDPPNYAPRREDSVEAMAEAGGRTPFEVVYDLLLEDDGRAMLFAPATGYANYNLDGVRELMENPRSVVALSDGGAHVAHIVDVSFSTYLLTYWGRDRPEGSLDVSWLVKRMTGDAAKVVGLNDRGIIAPGFKADINVIDHDRLKIEPPYMVHDLPQGAKRLLQRSQGYVATIVSGIPVSREGDPTGALPGRLVRGQQAAPA